MDASLSGSGCFPFHIEPGNMGMYAEEMSVTYGIQPPTAFRLESDSPESMLAFNVADTPHYRKVEGNMLMKLYLQGYIGYHDSQKGTLAFKAM